MKQKLLHPSRLGRCAMLHCPLATRDVPEMPKNCCYLFRIFQRKIKIVKNKHKICAKVRKIIQSQAVFKTFHTIPDHSWPVLIISDQSWLFMTRPDPSWPVLILPDQSWSFLTSSDYSWPVLIIPDKFELVLTSPDHFWPALIIPYQSWSFLTRHDHSKPVQITSD